MPKGFLLRKEKCSIVVNVNEIMKYNAKLKHASYSFSIRFRKLRESFGNETKEYFMKVLPHQQVRIVCPSSAAINDWVGQRISKRFQNFYLVDKNGYDNCKVNDDVNPSENKLLLLCDDFKQVRYRTFKFYPGSNLNEPRFIPGRHYYFIGKTTANGIR